ncbi:MAG: hypothetical protein ACRDG6_01385 [Candidatus Limnocylindria bacterium]
MRKVYTLPGLVGAFALLLALSVGANAAAAATPVATGATQTVMCPSGRAQLSSMGFFHDAFQGRTVWIDFTIADGCNVELSLVSYKAPSDTFSADTASQQVLFDSATGTFAAGDHILSVDLPNCFFQLDFVFGAPLATLGPAGSNNFYSAQGRLISAYTSGTSACSAAAPTIPDTGGTGTTGTVRPVTTTTATTVTTTVIPAGPITWAPGFGPSGAVASVQTAPTTGGSVAGTQTAPISVSNLPSTSTDGDNNGVILLGMASIAIGLVLLRAGRPVQAESRLD